MNTKVGSRRQTGGINLVNRSTYTHTHTHTYIYMYTGDTAERKELKREKAQRKNSLVGKEYVEYGQFPHKPWMVSCAVDILQAIDIL